MSPPSTDDGSETRPSRSRRRFLLGIGAGTAAMAGCLGRDDTTDDGSTNSSTASSPTTSFEPASELPYGEWLTAADGGQLFAYADLDAIPSSFGSDASLDESLEDPLIAYPLVLSQRAVGLGQLRLSFAGLTSAIAPEAESESTVDEVTVLDRTTVAEGTFATETLDDRLVEPTDETWGIAYERTDRVRGFDRYEPAEVPDSFDDDPPVVAVSGETVVVGPAVSRVQRMVTGGGERAGGFFQSDDTTAELFELAGNGDLVVGEFGPRDDESLDLRETFDASPRFEPRAGEDVLASLAFEESGDTVSSQFGLDADELAAERRETVETAFGTAALEGSVAIDATDRRITATGTYDVDSVWVTNDEPSTDEGLSQAEAAELVSPDALAFQYEPPGERQFGELWVTVLEETDAAALRVEAASGGYAELRPQDRSVRAGDSVAVQIDPGGDSATVSVVADDGSVGELASQSVPTDELSEAAASRAVPGDALSFEYESPDSGDYGSLTVEVVSDVGAETLIARPQNAPGVFAARTGSLASDATIETGTSLETAVDPAGDEVVVYATVGDATGVVGRWQGPR